MPEEPASEWTISEDELKHLTELFIQFDGAPDPMSVKCREVEIQFNSLIDKLFQEKVEPHFESITRHEIRHHTRYRCRQRAIRSTREFPCP